MAQRGQEPGAVLLGAQEQISKGWRLRTARNWSPGHSRPQLHRSEVDPVTQRAWPQPGRPRVVIEIPCGRARRPSSSLVRGP